MGDLIYFIKVHHTRSTFFFLKVFSLFELYQNAVSWPDDGMELGEELKEVITSGVLVVFLTTLNCRICSQVLLNISQVWFLLCEIMVLYRLQSDTAGYKLCRLRFSTY